MIGLTRLLWAQVRGMASTAEALVALADVEVLSPRVARILGQNPGSFTLQGTNTYVVGTGRRRILIDTGEGKATYAPLLERFLRENSIDIDRVIITHWHRDHTGGIGQVFDLSGKTIPVHKFLDEENDDELKESNISLEPVLDGAVFSAEGVTLRAVHTPGHTEDHLCLYMEEENAIFSGDCVLGQGTTHFTNLRQYMSSLRRIADTKCGMIYPAHGPVLPNGLDKVNEYIAHRQARENQVLELMGSMGPCTIDALVETIYANYPPSVHAAAAMGLSQHLEKLKEEGRVRHIEDEDTWVLLRSNM
mgnify:CR=1 FL=1